VHNGIEYAIMQLICEAYDFMKTGLGMTAAEMRDVFAGWNETEFTAFGFPFDHRISRFAEAFTIIRTLLREGAIDFAGEFFTARDCELVPRPRPGGPPLMIGSTGPRMLAITAPHVDSWNAWFDAFGNRPAGVGALRDQVDAAARAAGRDPAAIERTVAVQVRLPGGRGRVQGATAHDAEPPVEGSAEERSALTNWQTEAKIADLAAFCNEDPARPQPRAPQAGAGLVLQNFPAEALAFQLFDLATRTTVLQGDFQQTRNLACPPAGNHFFLLVLPSGRRAKVPAGNERDE